ncbi:hypothetical protein H6G04_16275 [Calothrix membranacea FACHB-236]|nr:hypothetical protein [Calothrix membranacea FACHB-236]
MTLTRKNYGFQHRRGLTPEDLSQIEAVAPKGTAAGDRYSDMSTVNR